MNEVVEILLAVYNGERYLAEQLDSIHGINECVSTDTLVPAVDFYRFMYQNV